MNLLQILSKKAQENLRGTPITELLSDDTINNNPELTVTDRKKLSIIRESYREYAIEKATSTKTKITSTSLAGELFQKILANEPREKFMVALLNTKNEILAIETIFTGTLNSTVVHPREIFSFAVKYPTARILLAHNHPSGDTEPSRADESTTRRLIEAGEVLGIEILDHIIVGREYLSMREQTFVFDC